MKQPLAINKPENPFQNYDVAKKTLKTNHDFFTFYGKRHTLWKKQENFGQNQKPDIISPGNL